MDFAFTTEQKAFREEIRDFLGTQSTPEVRGPTGESDDSWENLRGFIHRLADKRWLTLGWPREHGGLAADPMQQLVYNEEMAYQRAPTQIGVGPDRVGPTIMLYGTEQQQRDFLPAIAGGDAIFCQGFSEPGAGSDLASLQTRAVLQGDDYVVNGQKIWTSWAHRADWMVLLARTDPDAPKHRGISYLLLDMKSPGVTVRPLVDMLGDSHFNEVYFEDVHVPRTNLVGEENRGWYVGTATLDFERSGINRIISGYKTFEELVEYCRSERPSSLASTRNRLADIKIEFETGRLLSYRVAWMQAQSMVPNTEASISKLLGTELQAKLARLGLQIVGLPGALRAGSPWAALRGRLERYYLYTASLTVAAGTSEVMRNIIAMRGLGLPRQ
ncbi:MAG: acyl-CoA dehydrogenase [Dehalococcoidia bacterium]|nr:acyl-CoA dehydrogenase [Dehalococcoidia bacterium]